MQKISTRFAVPAFSWKGGQVGRCGYAAARVAGQGIHGGAHGGLCGGGTGREAMRRYGQAASVFA